MNSILYLLHVWHHLGKTKSQVCHVHLPSGVQLIYGRHQGVVHGLGAVKANGLVSDTNTCCQWSRGRGGSTWAFSLSLLQTSLRPWIFAITCLVSVKISWILSAISSRFCCIRSHCLEESKYVVFRFFLLKQEWQILTTGKINMKMNEDVVTPGRVHVMAPNTPALLVHAAPSFPSSCFCGCCVWPGCPASFLELASAGFPQCAGSSALSASSQTEPSARGSTHTHIDNC